MSAEARHLAEDDVDDHVDAELAACLDPASPKSFFLFAGAGSGKTRSLVTALQHIQNTQSDRLRVKGQRVGVITFTNAASDEIKRRLLFDPLIEVRTIHSFAWSLINGLNHDIREWLRDNLTKDINELKQTNSRPGTKAAATRLSRIESKSRRLGNLANIKRFVYSPTGDNRGRDALNHSEVLQLTAYFLIKKPAMQSILVGRYPILLIDESQDTNKHLVEALFTVQASLKGKFLLGLVGDMMQRIYNDGKDGLGDNLPGDWATPGKKLNYRCPRRVVALINKVRSTVDKQEQAPRSTASEGFVRLFVLPCDHANKPGAEATIARHMAVITGDSKWNEPKAVKTLTLEHRMAAARLGFLDVFTPLYEVDSWRTSFLEGTLPITRFFSDQVLPIVRARQSRDEFAVARIAKAYSPLLSQSALRKAEDKKGQLKTVSAAIDELVALFNDNADPSLLQVLRTIGKSNLFEMPEGLLAHASDAVETSADGGEAEAEGEVDDRESEREQ